MDIKQATAPAAAKTSAADKNDAGKDNNAQGEVLSPAFAQLLQGLQTVSAEAPGAAQDVLQVPSDAGGVLPSEVLSLGVDSLLGQTQRLDAIDADAAMQDGSFLLAKQESGLLRERLVGQTQEQDRVDEDAALQNGMHLLAGQRAGQDGLSQVALGAQPHTAAGQSVATVAAGAQADVDGDALPLRAAVALNVLAETADAVEQTAQTVVDSLQADGPQEGRVALHGAWKLEDPQTPLNPALQRLMGQVEQWASATAGVQPKPIERSEHGKNTAQSAEWLSGHQGSGTRLMESAVQEAQAAQDAAFEAPADAPVEDMRFWLQGKQQRAEVVLEKDGQPVRVQVMVRGNEAYVTFRAEQAQTRELLDASLAQLRDMLQQQGFELLGVSVQADAQGQSSASEQGARNPWEAAPARQAQVAVPVHAEQAVRAPRTQGLDFYV